MKKYRTGLVVGKFCPLHKGHEYVIREALKQSEQVVILSYTSENYSHCSSENRRIWLQDLAKRLGVMNRLKIHVLDPSEVTILDNASDEEHRKFCADYLLNVVETTVQAVFNSEEYGQGFVDYLILYFASQFKTPIPMVVRNELVDINRIKYDISGTRLRNDRSLIYEYCNDAVITSFIPKILFLGGESSGKTTIVSALTKHFKYSKAVFEFGRHWYDERNGLLKYEDMQYIAEQQIIAEELSSEYESELEFLFCDTSALTTSFYSQDWFGRVSAKLQKMAYESVSRYDKIYVCIPDFPMVQDGTRQDEAFRMKAFKYAIDALEFAGAKYSLLSCSEQERFDRVVKDLSAQMI